ncbi:MAG: type II CAAX endopeptidase family protein [Bacteroidota bacterium]
MDTPLIRQGWLRVIIFLITWLLIQAGIINMLYNLVLPSIQNGNDTDPGLKLLLASFLSFLFTVPAVLLFRKLIDRKSFISLGFHWKRNSTHAITGFLSALFIMSAGTLLLLLTGNIYFIAIDFYWQDFMLYLLIMLLVAIAEELVIRGYILNNLMESFPKWTSLIISATLFAAIHFLNPGFTWLSMLGIFVGGILIGLNYIYTKNLWFGIFFHFAWNFFQGPILGYQVSGLETESLMAQNINGPIWLTGGPFGFESSVVACFFILVVLGYLALYYKKNQHAFTAAG